MTDLQKLTSLFDALGVHYRFDSNTEGWGLPEYREHVMDMDYPPYIQEVTLGCTNLYFSKEGAYLGWWNNEFSMWHGRSDGG